MNVDVAQRWRDRCAEYRPRGEPINPHAYEIVHIAGDNEVKAFVEQHHYSASFPAAVERFGLMRRGELVGVCIFSEPMQGKVLDVLPCPRDQAVELGRLVLLDDVPSNGESWLVAECFRRMTKLGYTGVVSFSDPQPRRTPAGEVLFAGHIGTVYKSLNAVYTGLSSPRTQWMLPDCTIISERSLSKIRSLERGVGYAVGQLVEAGAAPPADGVDLAAWMRGELPKIARSIRHRGSHRYLWPLDKACARALVKHLEARPQRAWGPFPYPQFKVPTCRADQLVPAHLASTGTA